MNHLPTVVGRLAETVVRAPASPVLISGRNRISYSGLWSRVVAVAATLQAQGLQRGDRVALLLENSIDYVAVYYGALAVGAVAVALNHSARAYEIDAWLRHSGARWLFADARHPDFPLLAKSMSPSCRLIATDADAPHAEHVETDGSATFMPTPLPDDPAAIIYTSGTTGRPKGVTLTHRNLASNTAAIVDYLHLSSSDRVINVLPFFYAYGSSVLHSHLWAGASIVLENSMAFPRHVLARMVEERVTGFPGVPSTFAILLGVADIPSFDLSQLRYVTQAGGPMPRERILRVREVLPHVKLFVMYGQTEATARLTYLPPEQLERKLGSVGIPLPGVDIQIRDDRGNVLPALDVGEVCVRGPNVMSGYFGDLAASAVALRDGWLHTGDNGYLDTDGYLFLEGRRSDIIKSGAHRINPIEIEEVIGAVPGVSEVAVIGVADDVLGEVIKALITVRDGQSVDELAIKRYCSERLAKYKVPKIVEVVATLPRTTSGKIMRHRLGGNGHEHAEVRSA